MKTLDEVLATLDNLTESWKQHGHPGKHKVQAEAMNELRQHIAAPSAEPARKGKARG